METKKLLKIAYAITEFQDFITDEFTFENVGELNLDFEPTEEEINKVMTDYDGWGSDYVVDEIVRNYFSE